MGNVISFRPTPEERRLLDQVRRKHRLRSQSDAVRFLLQEGAKADPEDPDERFWRLRVPPEFRLKGRSISSEEIDEVVYGDHIWSDPRSG